ncbi:MULTISPECIES: hypothetical protein [Eikenella]|uniref:hypothetical protein n=1 Tax=Eikenella TaxID=538 RepID=UPI0009EE667F|nr:MULTISPECIES: hypothetical protein [Eikenella]
MQNLKKIAIEAHSASFKNKSALEKEQLCGCFYCQRIYSSSELKDEDFIPEDDGVCTAWCPYCGIDSVIGESQGYEITPELLAEMRRIWFDS